MITQQISKSSKSEKSPVSLLELLKNQIVADLKPYDISLLNYVIALDNVHLVVDPTQKRLSVVAGISRGCANQISIPRLVAKGYITKQRRDTYDTCVYTISALWKQPYMRRLLADIFPAMRGIPVGLIKSNFHIEKSLKQEATNLANDNLITPIIKEEQNKYLFSKKYTEEKRTVEYPPPKDDSFVKIESQKSVIFTKSPQRDKKDFVLAPNSPWNIPYPWAKE